MFLKYFIRKLQYITGFRKAVRTPEETHKEAHWKPEETESGTSEEKEKEPMKAELKDNLGQLLDMLGNSNDVKKHVFRFGPDNTLSGALVFIDGLADSKTITDAILRPLITTRMKGLASLKGENLLDAVSENALFSGDVETVESLSELAAGCLSGDTALLLEGCQAGLIISSKGWEKRGVSEPQSEAVVRGPREGFTENLRTNTSMIRRKIHHGKLIAEQLTVGRKTRTGICLMYLDGVANPDVVKKVKYRIENLEVDSILESGYIEEYIEDAPFSPFSTIGYSEKPDVVASRILEGRVAIVVDGTPFVLTAPMLFIESFQSTEDYYVRPLYASLVRILRFIAFFIAVFGPAVYIALTVFHQEMIPTTLLFTIANAREGTPFPVFIETAIMVITFEILREAGVRLPRPVGQAISIVGALVMGDAAVSAGLVGAPVVIAVSLTAVSGFLVPNQYDAASMLRIIMMILAALIGGYGISMGFLGLLIHLASLTSFGVPYFQGLSFSRNLEDAVVRMPLWTMVKRPKGIAYHDITRRRFFIPPLRPHQDEDGQKEN